MNDQDDQRFKPESRIVRAKVTSVSGSVSSGSVMIQLTSEDQSFQTNLQVTVGPEIPKWGDEFRVIIDGFPAK